MASLAVTIVGHLFIRVALVVAIHSGVYSLRDGIASVCWVGQSKLKDFAVVVFHNATWSWAKSQQAMLNPRPRHGY